MGLDISLIKIVPKPVNKNNWLVCPESPELHSKYGGLRCIKKDKDGGICEVYWYEELAYQRKGVRRSFYKNYDHDEFLFTRDELLKLFKYIDWDYKASFENDFVTQFKEGENLIMLCR